MKTLLTKLVTHAIPVRDSRHRCSRKSPEILRGLVGGLLFVSFLTFMTACSDSISPSSAVTPPVVTPPADPVAGIFVDDPVQGLGYSSSYHDGSTNETGTFQCTNRDDTVTFYVGDLVLGSAVCSEIVSPVDLVSGGHTRHSVVMAIAGLLQSFDGDGDRANGVITITEDVVAWVNEGMGLRGLSEQSLTDLSPSEILLLAKEIVGLSHGNESPDDDLVYVPANVAAAHLEQQLASDGLYSYYVQEAYLDEQVSQIGGSTTIAEHFADGTGQEWTLFNVAHRFSITRVQPSEGEVYELPLAAYIRDIEIIETETMRYALVALGEAGIAVVDISDPTAPTLRHSVRINYYQDGLMFAEGGGSLVLDFVIESDKAFISSLAADTTTLWIGDQDYGIHRTALSNLLGEIPVTGEDGTLIIDHEVFTLQYAGEHPWGGPLDLKLYEGSLYVAQQFLGVGIYNPETLDRIGYYNLYTDTSVTEDWFIDLDVATQAQNNFIDAETGMPNYDQASFEILEVWHNGIEAPTPWADFDRYGKYYYNPRSLEVAEMNDGDGGVNTRLFVAYSLAGVVALDVDNTDPANPQLSYLGYAPAVPAHGPDKPRNEQSRSLFPYFGAGMLKEAGVVDVAVDPETNRVYYTDHFASLVALDGADDPAENWHQDGAPFNNDTIGELGDHWPDYEFVTSYDMSDYDPEDNESLPLWIYTAPSALVTGEISGHGNQFVLTPSMDDAAGSTDIVLANGSGGLDFIDLRDFTDPKMSNRFAVMAHFATTNEIGAAVDGSATADVSIGHTQGLVTKGRYLYVADGPHGMSVFEIADADGAPIDEPRLVANTLMEEYPEDSDGTTVYPTPHAYNIVMGTNGENAFVMSQSLGLRRVDITEVDAGEGIAGAPLLLTPQPSDFYEHNTSDTNYFGLHRQDHTYDVDFYESYAVVADGSNGITVFDLAADPTLGVHVLGNLGSSSEKPGLGRASGVELWTDYLTGRIYAFVAAGYAGVGVVDMTGLLRDGDSSGIELIKLFEPIKIEVEEDGSIHIGKASSRSIDVDVVGDNVYFTYGDFGVLVYSITDLIAPLPEGVEPNAIWGPHEDFDYRPEALAQFVITEEPGMEDVSAESLYMVQQYFPAGAPLHDDSGAYELEQDRLLFYIGYGGAGVAKIDWSDTASPVLLQYQDTVGEASGTTLAHGRVYVSDGGGGLSIFRPTQD